MSVFAITEAGFALVGIVAVVYRLRVTISGSRKQNHIARTRVLAPSLGRDRWTR